MFTVYIVILVLASLVLAAVGVYAWRQRARNPSAAYFGGMALATSLWSLAPRPDAARYKKLRLTLEAAPSQMHQRLHQQGVFHQHSPVHNHVEHREH